MVAGSISVNEIHNEAVRHKDEPNELDHGVSSVMGALLVAGCGDLAF